MRLTGFKEFVRRAVHLGAGEHPVIDVRLDVGDASQSVEVTADAPLINSENASRRPGHHHQRGGGPAVERRHAHDDGFARHGGAGHRAALAGAAVRLRRRGRLEHRRPAVQTNELLIDGAPNGTWDGRLAYSPPKDAVQEVRVKVFETDAAYGHSGAGTANQILKSGSNRCTARSTRTTSRIT